MSKLLALFHTSQMHIRRFETLRDELAPELELRHVVREDLLQRAISVFFITLLSILNLTNVSDHRRVMIFWTRQEGY